VSERERQRDREKERERKRERERVGEGGKIDIVIINDVICCIKQEPNTNIEMKEIYKSQMFTIFPCKQKCCYQLRKSTFTTVDNKDRHLTVFDNTR